MTKFIIRTGVFFCVLFFSPGSMVLPSSKTVVLPKPRLSGPVSLERAVMLRHSQRDFSERELTLPELGQLLWAGQGITRMRNGFHFRAAPSAGGLYPVEIYVVSRDGVRHYLPAAHSLEILDDKDRRQELAEAALGQVWVARAPVDIVLCAVYERVRKKYGPRADRYALIEIGHIAQNIHLQAAAMGLGSVPVGAFEDETVKTILALPGDHAPLYIIPVGYPAQAGPRGGKD